MASTGLFGYRDVRVSELRFGMRTSAGVIEALRDDGDHVEVTLRREPPWGDGPVTIRPHRGQVIEVVGGLTPPELPATPPPPKGHP